MLVMARLLELALFVVATFIYYNEAATLGEGKLLLTTNQGWHLRKHFCIGKAQQSSAIGIFVKRNI